MMDAYLLDPKKKLDQYLNKQSDFDRKIVDYTSDEAYTVGRLTADKKSTFLEFIDDIRTLWKKHDDELCDIIRAFPNKQEMAESVITFRLLQRKVNEEFKDYKPRFRTSMPHPHREKETIQVFGQVFDLVVEFMVSSFSAENADMLVVEFEDFIQRYAGHFKSSGVQEILFKEQLEDIASSDHRIEMHKRPLIYTIRLERLTVKYENELDHIGLQAKIYNQNK